MSGGGRLRLGLRESDVVGSVSTSVPFSVEERGNGRDDGTQSLVFVLDNFESSTSVSFLDYPFPSLHLSYLCHQNPVHFLT